MSLTPNIPFRIGHGYDVHRFVKGRPLFLGGLEIPCEFGLDGHSDADALLHALCDALLGAVAHADIGQLFPNTDAQWKGASSLVLLNECLLIVQEKGWIVGNLDLTVISEFPKLSPHYERMRCVIAEHCKIEADCVGIKATTNEKMGFLGRGEGVAAFAVVLLIKKL